MAEARGPEALLSPNQAEAFAATLNASRALDAADGSAFWNGEGRPRQEAVSRKFEAARQATTEALNEMWLLIAEIQLERMGGR